MCAPRNPKEETQDRKAHVPPYPHPMDAYTLSPPAAWQALHTRTYHHTGDLCLETEAYAKAHHHQQQPHAGPTPTLAVPALAIPPSTPAPSSDPLLSAITDTLGVATGSLDLVSSLDGHHRRLASRTTQLHEECKRLVEEESRLRGVVHTIYHPLSYFDSLLVLGRRLGMSGDPGEASEALTVLREVQRLGSIGAGGPVPAPGTFPSPPHHHHHRTGTAATAITTAAIPGNPHRVRLIDKLLTPEDEEFPLALERIDECVAFLAANGARFRDATQYISRFSALRLRALGMVAGSVREAVESVSVAVEKEVGVARAALAAATTALALAQNGINSASASASANSSSGGTPGVRGAGSGGSGSSSGSASGSVRDPHAVARASAALSAAQSNLDTVELYQLQLRFRADLGHLRRLMGLVEARGAKRAYGEVLQECYSAYATRRASLVVPMLQDRVGRMVKERVKSMLASPPPPSPSAHAAFNGAASTTTTTSTAHGGFSAALTTPVKGALPTGNANDSSPPPSSPNAAADAAAAIAIAQADDRDETSSTSSTLHSLVHRPPPSRAGTVMTTATRDTAGRASVALWAEDTSARESVVLDAVRSASSMVSRAVLAEHSLFHNLFLAPRSTVPAAAAGGAGAGAGGGSGEGDPYGDMEWSSSSPLPGRHSSASSVVASGRYSSARRGFSSPPHYSGSGGQHQHQQQPGGLDAITTATAGYVRAASDSVLSGLCEEVSNVLGDVLRPLLLSVTSLEVLFDAAHVLRDEVLGELCGGGGGGGGMRGRGGGVGSSPYQPHHHHSSSSSFSGAASITAPSSSAARAHALAPFSRACESLLADLCDRLSFRAQAFIKERIDRYRPNATPKAFPLPLLPCTTSSGTSVTLASIRVMGDTDNPARLVAYYLRQRAAAAAAAAAAGTGAGASIHAGGHQQHQQQGGLLAFLPPPPPPSIWDSWFPLLELTLVLLSKLYRTLERGSFEALAQDAVAACTKKLVAAGEEVRRGGGGGVFAAASLLSGGTSLLHPDAYMAGRCTVMTPGGEALPPGALTRDLFSGAVTLLDSAGVGAVAALAAGGGGGGGGAAASLLAQCARDTAECDGLLFTIKNLLVLREQLSPFSVSLTSTTQTLDFTSTSTALATLLSNTLRSGGRALLTLSSNTNPLLEFLATGMPRVAEERVNFKAHLEDLLRRTCDTLITRFHGALVGGVVAHLRAAATTTVTAPATAGAAAASPPPPSPGSGSTAAAPPSTTPMIITVTALVPPSSYPTYGSSLGGVLDKTTKDMEALLPTIRRRLGLYLGSPMTAAILFSPVRDRVLQTFASLRQSVYEALIGEGGGGEVSAGDASTTTAATQQAQELRAALEGKITRALAVLEASDSVVVDPHSAAFGHDNGVFAAKVASIGSGVQKQ